VVRLSAPIVCPGLFYAVPAQDGSLFRLRIPGGVLTSHQARAIANLATELGDGEVQVTNRANLQIRAVGAQIPAEVLKQLQRLGWQARSRKLIICVTLWPAPTAGIDSQAVMDTRS
jgi:ferredoxin-nitrite reductase